jgi:transcriptional regulator with XRE-family HTH domain
VETATIGRQLRVRRTAAGRTVASVAADAGLSVPYIANLENGRGNPTTTALTRLAAALGMQLVVTLAPADGSPQPDRTSGPVPEMPAALTRLGRTRRFRQTTEVIAKRLELDLGEFSFQLVAALATLARALDKDLGEADWWRILDAILLTVTHPVTDQQGIRSPR